MSVQSTDQQRKFRINGTKAESRMFVNNEITTAKYNFLTFLPLAILYQFKSQFNVFQLATAIILSIKQISPFEDFTSSLVPFLIIIAFGLIREAIEDVKKTMYDVEYNNSLTQRYNMECKLFNECKWKKLKVGNIIKVLKNEILPADILIIKSSNVNGFCYLQTTNLDGETALKPKETLTCFNDYVMEESQLELIEGVVEIDHPNNNIYKVEGSIIKNLEEKVNFTIENILLRGGKLQNVNFVYGIVIYTGKDTKLMQNIEATSSKLSYLDIQLNSIIRYILIIMLFLTALSTGLGIEFQLKYSPVENVESVWYIYPYNPSIPIVTPSETILEVIIILAAFFINYNTFIPLSLMVLIELIKPIQVIILSSDKDMKGEGEEFKVLSMKLQENLGSVKYIFSDKTGTLTKNEMYFHSCSIYGNLFEPDITIQKVPDKSRKTCEEEKGENNGKLIKKEVFNDPKVSEKLIENLYCKKEIVNMGVNGPFTTISDALIEFFIGISLNHNILPEIDEKTNEIIFTGSSPDEVTLITAINSIGVRFIERVGNTITIQLDEYNYKYEILFQFGFTSDRKRSSMIVKDPNNNIKLYMKGADDVILSKINEYSKLYVQDTTKKHMEKFAKLGLRTLCYTVKILSEEYFTKWSLMHEDLKYRSIADKSLEKEVENLVSEMEDNSYLLGVTGLEDKLQDDVKGVISDFIDADINVWMLTGDKLDTAESIGFSCKLFNHDTEVIKIRSGTKDVIRSEILKALEDIETCKNEILNFKIENKPKIGKKSNKKVRFENETLIQVNTENCFGKVETVNIIEEFRRDSKILFDVSTPDDQEIDWYRYKKKEQKEHSRYNNYFQGDLFDLNYKDIRSRNRSKSFEFFENYLNKNSKKRFSVLDKGLVEQYNKKSKYDEEIITRNNKKYVNNDLAILKFIIKKKQEESMSKNYEKEENNHTIINNIINKNDHDDSENEFSSNNQNNEANGAEFNKKDLFSINNVYNHYDEQIKRISKAKVQLVNKLEIIDKEKKKNEEKNKKVAILINFGLIIEGHAITEFVDPELSELSWSLVNKCRAVICCRCNPLQKSEIVKYVRRNTDEILLSIGDGGNDVNMIKEAHIGVGVFGKEGYQAAYSSDYAIAQFKYLRKLLFVHGRSFILRNSYFIIFFLYKNLLFTLPQLFLSFVSGSSGTNFYSYYFYMGYNSLFTVVPHAMRMIYEEDVDPELKEKPLIAKKLIPYMYNETRESRPFTMQKYIIVVIVCFAQCAVMYFFPYAIFYFGIADSDGRTQGFWDISLSVFMCVLIIQFIILIHDTFYWNKNVLIGWAWQIGSMILFINLMEVMEAIDIHNMIFSTMSNLCFWLTVAISTIVSTLGVTLYQRLILLFKDSVISNIRLEKYHYDNSTRIIKKKIEKASEISRNFNKFKKIINTAEYVPKNYADKRVKTWVESYLSTYGKDDAKIENHS